MPHKISAYVDTSVFGGVHDDEFSEPSRLFFQQAAAGKYSILVSQITLDELSLAPTYVRKVLEDLPSDAIIEVAVEPEMLELAQTYISRGALGQKWLGDAIRVAIATLSQADLILSWNFRYIVNYDRIRKFNSANMFLGYRQLEIRSPLEVVYAEEDEEI